jgi:hypothetical protein
MNQHFHFFRSIKDVDLSDLLGRETVRLDSEAIRAYLSGRRVLVTGCCQHQPGAMATDMPVCSRATCIM